MSYLDANIMPAVAAERARHERGYATFEHVWLLYKPGSDVVVDGSAYFAKTTETFWLGCVVAELRMETDYLGGGRSRRAWTVGLWGLVCDGICVGRFPIDVRIAEFGGEVKVTSLSVVPAYWPGHKASNNEYWADELKANGRKAYTLSRPQFLQHSGKAIEFPHDSIEGLVMSDMRGFFADNPRERPHPLPERTYSSGVIGCYCSVCKSGKRDLESDRVTPQLFMGYDRIPIDADSLTEHQSLLLLSRVFVFHFSTRIWQLVDVKNLRAAQYHPGILDTLVMKPERINMLKALSKNYVRPDDDKSGRPKEFWSADFIKGKGKSQIILLHGKPGVGKTYTAECIAEHTKRPLMSLTCADIGTNPEEVEENLAYHFTAARDWGAFVLIDEADIYMEVCAFKTVSKFARKYKN